jgi:hypothetical protein
MLISACPPQNGHGLSFTINFGILSRAEFPAQETTFFSHIKFVLFQRLVGFIDAATVICSALAIFSVPMLTIRTDKVKAEILACLLKIVSRHPAIIRINVAPKFVSEEVAFFMGKPVVHASFVDEGVIFVPFPRLYVLIAE